MHIIMKNYPKTWTENKLLSYVKGKKKCISNSNIWKYRKMQRD